MFGSRFLAMVLALVALGTASAEDWRQFRGNDANGVAHDDHVPTHWNDSENIAWKIDLPGRGLSSPIVVGERVYLTASTGVRQERMHVLCFSAASGEKLWERQFWATGRTTTHPTTCNAAPTPCSDGKRIFASFSSNDVVCLDLEGNLEWFRGLTHDFPNASNSLGMSSSPVVVGGTLVCMVECDAESFTTGLDVETGVSRWKLDRPRRANWTSPGILRGETRAEDRVLVQSTKGVVALDPMTGKSEWNYGEGASSIPSLAVYEQVAYVPSNGITALRPSPTGSDVPEMLWRAQGTSPGTGSPVSVNGAVYLIASSGVLTRLEADTGKKTVQTRLKGGFSGSPVIAGGRLYVFSEPGVGQVVELGPEKCEVVHSHDFKEPILCTPAIANGALYVRSDKHLWKIAAP